VSERIPVEVLASEGGSARLVYASPFLERVVLLSGEEAYECPWDLVPLFRGRLGTYRLTLESWDYRAWCEQGCNHFYVYVFRKGSEQARRVRIGGKRVYAVLEGPTVLFAICSRTKGMSAPWVK
jgi:mRNA-degrading endonuclease RelE of RelBE toxin-antitoxin system